MRGFAEHLVGRPLALPGRVSFGVFALSFDAGEVCVVASIVNEALDRPEPRLLAIAFFLLSTLALLAMFALSRPGVATIAKRAGSRSAVLSVFNVGGTVLLVLIPAFVGLGIVELWTGLHGKPLMLVAADSAFDLTPVMLVVGTGLRNFRRPGRRAAA